MTAVLSATSATRLVALLGDPVAHSLSPRFQNAAFAAAAVDGVYIALRCDASTLPGLLAGIARAGGAGNVTIPHKAQAASIIEVATGAVRRTRACNTFWLEHGRIHGDNTDVAGFRAAVHALIGSPAGARVLLLGAGGAASAAVCALLDDGVGAIDVVGRSPERVRALVAAFDAGGRLRAAPGAAPSADERYDLVVNATPLGLHAGDPWPLDLDRFPGVGAVLDLVYTPGETAWVRDARRRGIVAADGREMLLAQGAAAFERWWGRPAPIDAMRRALEAAAATPAGAGDA
ncbi:MAG TPA: shikimate dehydrogenase [Longimicrobiales bacterium]